MSLSARTNELIQKAGFKLDLLKRTEFPVLSKIDIAGKLKVRPEQLTQTITLTPGKPRSGKSFLKFYSPMMVLTEDLASNDIALFYSKFPDIGFIGVQVSFSPVTKGKAHLVEFHITLNEPQKAYKFRTFEYPFSTFQDITVSNQQVLYVIVPAADADITELGAEIQQRNTPAEEAGWIFRSVRITSIA